jgi:phospholipase/carboxylesterase
MHLLTMKIKNPTEDAAICIIWMHGLGSNAANMMALAEELPLTLPVRHVCIDAPVRPVTFNNHIPMRAWYDITGFKASDREDKSGILQSTAAIHDIIEAQLVEGFEPSQIILAGFSQGGAMALVAGLCSKHAIGGMVSLSAYLPLASIIKTNLNRETPIFVGSGLHDQVVIPAWTEASVQWLNAQGFSQVEVHKYPMEHTVCFEEVNEMANWLATHATSTRL